MRLLRILLTALFSIFFALGISQLVMGEMSFIGIIATPAYLATALALHNRGGKFARYIGYFTCSLLSLSLLGAIYFLILPFLGDAFKPIPLVVLLTIGLVGLVSFRLIKENNKSKVLEIH
ncbi:hypothetical protein A8L45_06445 [Veronia pacifica]|uniref:Uncharacterized protein n=2 Tax=Veronia pacifica TaxID=1080227 RepID=A0A1C3EM99_9GAMM|nr:hypothetical protein A8L45_06445 [Veronia pacifica]